MKSVHVLLLLWLGLAVFLVDSTSAAAEDAAHADDESKLIPHSESEVQEDDTTTAEKKEDDSTNEYSVFQSAFPVYQDGAANKTLYSEFFFYKTQ